ncbi:hypothetical protein BDF19DRAFT_415143 [Syncephalis fuscata]|nr:hypothetical protein BDF19DRAFT_415143 [Syncephalis fuscata]
MDIDGASKVFTTAIVDSASTVNQRRTSSGSNNGQNNPNIPENLPPTEAFCRQKEPDDAVGILEENVMDPTERLLDGLNVHIHHWQIFLILAFFTRFQDIVSQVSAGLVLACFMQGGIAYGFDAMLEPRYTMVVV